MTTQTCKAHVYMSLRPDSLGQLSTWPHAFMANSDLKYLGEYPICVEMPSDFDPRLAAVDILEEKIENLRADTENEITRWRGQINDLLALPNPSIVNHDDDPF